MKIDLSDKTLFGNEAGEDEIENIFTSYAVERPEVGNFLATDTQIAIIRAYKGEGKSALLRLVSLGLKRNDSDSVIIMINASSISPKIEGTDSDEWVRAWKLNILKHAAREIGSRISLAFSDDAITLVEEAESSGFKSRSFVTSVVDRLKSSAVPIEKNKQPMSNPEKLLTRWAEHGDRVWFVIDDLDQNFENLPVYRTKIATFFIAIRQITALIPDFRFRASVRPNVWTIVKREYEALSHVEQYMTDLSWSLVDFNDLISKRIEGYLKRNNLWESAVLELSDVPEKRSRQLIGMVFQDPMPWGNGNTRPPSTIMYTLARHRPRWLVELWKVSSRAAKKSNCEVINLTHINSELDSFGKRRIEDTVAEFKSQCPQVEELLVAFIGEPEWFSTESLIETINRRILQKIQPKINGVIGAPSHWEVAHFLYQIGLLTARKELPTGGYDHISFAENPTLLSSRTNIDQGHSWEIHPVFRQALKLKNA